jgi:FkbM family methyltransferase
MIQKIIQKIDDTMSWLLGNTCNEKNFLKNFFKKKITYIDIGVNQGSFYKKISKICKIKKAILIDPIIFPLKIIKNNTILIKTGLSNKIKNKKFYHYNITAHSSFYKRNNILGSLSTLKKVEIIKTETLDNIFFKNNLKYIDFIKIDAQNEEYNILLGAKKVLKNKKITLIKVEISNISFYKNQKSNFYLIVHYLNKYNYSLINISKIKYHKNHLAMIDAYFSRDNFVASQNLSIT